MKFQTIFSRLFTVLLFTVFASNFSFAQTSTAAITTSTSTTAGSIDYSITGADMTAGYTIYYENATPTTTVGSTYTTGTLYESITTGAGGTASGTSTVTFTSSGTYYAILVDNTTFQVAAVDIYGSSVSATSTATAAITFSLTTNPSGSGVLGINPVTAVLPSSFSFQWYNSTSLGGSWTAINGASGTASTTAMVDLLSNDVTCGYYYYLEITSSGTTYQDDNYSAGGTVAITDNIDPTITAPAAVRVNVDAGVCTTALANVTLGTPTTGDNCSVASTTNDAPASFPLGATTVTYTVTDGSGNTATATQVVTVVDNIDPTIVCPASFTAYGAADSTLTSVSWTAATGSDNCSIDTVYSDVQIGTYFPLGATIVTYVAIDGSGNTDTCSFTITVVDTVSPVITNCPGDITQNNDLDSCGAVVNWTAPTYYDNSGHYTVSASHASGDYFPVGTTDVTITVADSSGNTSVCTFDVTVVDNQAPYVLPFNSVAVTLGTDGMYTLAVNDVDSASYDNCGITAKYLSKSFFNCNDVPSVTTWLVIEDIHGNKDSSLVTVQVALNTTPVLSVVETLGDVLCYGDSTGNASIAVNGGVSPYVYNWSNGSATSQAQNLSLGSYWYEVTDTNGCYTTDTVFIDQPNQLVGIDSIIACDSYTWIDGITYFSSNNTAMTTISGQNGCDSVVTLNLNINKIDSTIVRLGSTIYTQSGYDSYQWFECTSNGLVALNNQTNDSITITVNGDYAVVITNEGCSDTSTCIAINDIGFNEYIDVKFSLFPNPTTGKIKIVKEGSSISNNSYQLQLIDGRGRLVGDRKVNFRDNFILIDLENYTSGVYHLILINENEVFREQISLVH